MVGARAGRLQGGCRASCTGACRAAGPHGPADQRRMAWRGATAGDRCRACQPPTPSTPLPLPRQATRLK
jgi:hypothetical protein